MRLPLRVGTLNLRSKIPNIEYAVAVQCRPSAVVEHPQLLWNVAAEIHGVGVNDWSAHADQRRGRTIG